MLVYQRVNGNPMPNQSVFHPGVAGSSHKLPQRFVTSAELTWDSPPRTCVYQRDAIVHDSPSFTKPQKKQKKLTLPCNLFYFWPHPKKSTEGLVFPNLMPCCMFSSREVPCCRRYTQYIYIIHNTYIYIYIYIYMTVCQNCQQLVQNLCQLFLATCHRCHSPRIGSWEKETDTPIHWWSKSQTFPLNQSIEHHMCCLNSLKSPFWCHWSPFS